MRPLEMVERDAFRSLGAAPGVQCKEVGGAVCMSIPALPDVPMVNHVVGLGIDEPAVDHVLDAAAAFYADVGVRYYACVAPSATPPDLRERLAARGFTHGYDWMKLTRGVGVLDAADTALEVRRVDATSGDDFTRVVCGGYGMPASVEPTIAAVPGVSGWSCYVAYDGNEPAAAGALFVSGGVGWLGLAATLPDHRRKGGQGAILAVRIERARELGVRALVTETGVRDEGRASNSYRNILRSGFEEAYVRENYLSPALD